MSQEQPRPFYQRTGSFPWAWTCSGVQLTPYSALLFIGGSHGRDNEGETERDRSRVLNESDIEVLNRL